MSKNRTMAAKNAKAVKYAIEYTASMRCYEIQYEGILARNNNGAVPYNVQRDNSIREQAMSIADVLTMREFPVWERTVYKAIVDKKHVKAEFSEESRYWDACYNKVVSLLDRGMKADDIVSYWTL